MDAGLPEFGKVVIFGTGLIGGSFVLDLKRQGLVEKVVGIDLDADNLARALERKVIDEAFEEINAQSVGGADWVLIATPVATLPRTGVGTTMMISCTPATCAGTAFMIRLLG